MLTGATSAGIPSFLDREPRNQIFECMGFYEINGPCGNIYWSGDCPVAEGLLYDRPMIPDALREFWDRNDIALFFRGCSKPVYRLCPGTPARDATGLKRCTARRFGPDPLSVIF